jgi:tripartite-type tricarboxylate transporter receptor subunit TctC
MMLRALAFVLAGAAVLSAGDVQAQANYPTRAITYIVPYNPGGASDTTARLVAQRLSEALGQPVTVENRAGGVGVVALARSRPDGYTIGHISSDSFSITPHFGTAQYDPFKDFTLISGLITTFTALVANKSFGPSTVAELVAYAKANPGKVTHASSGTGGYSHLLGEILKLEAGIDMLHVPYTGSGPAMVDLLAGRIDLLFDSTPVERVSSGTVKGLAAMGKSRIKQLPNLPTMSEQLPSYKGGDIGWGLIGPAGMPMDIVRKLSDTMRTISATPDYIQKVQSYGWEVSYAPYGEYEKVLRQESDVYGDTIKRANIKIQ